MCNSRYFKHDQGELFMTKVKVFFIMEHMIVIMWNLGITTVTDIFVVLLLKEFDSHQYKIRFI